MNKERNNRASIRCETDSASALLVSSMPEEIILSCPDKESAIAEAYSYFIEYEPRLAAFKDEEDYFRAANRRGNWEEL